MLPETQDALILALKQRPGGTAKEIAPQLGWGSSATSARLAKLVHLGFARREPNAYRNRMNSPTVEYRYWFVPGDPEKARQYRCKLLGIEADRMMARELER